MLTDSWISRRRNSRFFVTWSMSAAEGTSPITTRPRYTRGKRQLQPWNLEWRRTTMSHQVRYGNELCDSELPTTTEVTNRHRIRTFNPFDGRRSTHLITSGQSWSGLCIHEDPSTNILLPSEMKSVRLSWIFSRNKVRLQVSPNLFLDAAVWPKVCTSNSKVVNCLERPSKWTEMAMHLVFSWSRFRQRYDEANDRRFSPSWLTFGIQFRGYG